MPTKHVSCFSHYFSRCDLVGKWMVSKIKELQKLSCGCEQHLQGRREPIHTCHLSGKPWRGFGQEFAPIAPKEKAVLPLPAVCLFPSLHTPRQPLKGLVFGVSVGLPLQAEQCNNQLRVQGPPKVPALSWHYSAITPSFSTPFCSHTNLGLL